MILVKACLPTNLSSVFEKLSSLQKDFCLPRATKTLKLKLSKFKFMQRETQYLDFRVSEDGIMADPDTVKVIRQMLPPACVREVRCFIDICSYYRRFNPKFSAIAKPLIRLSKKFANLNRAKNVGLFLTFSK